MLTERFRVMHADDVESLRALVRVALEQHGPFVVVAEAENGAEAVELARRFKPDLILLDVAMPVRSGIEALPELVVASPGSKVVVLSSHEEEGLAGRALAAGATAYLAKGLDPEMLAHQLAGIMSATDDVDAA